jgi:formylglycine-generating enzyme required for sulfatase activity
MKAMATEPSRRYRKVPLLRADLEAWAGGRTLKAVEYSALERTVKWVRRNRALSTVAAVIAFSAIALAGVLWWSATARDIAEKVGREVGAKVARQEREKAARAVLDQNLKDAESDLWRCESVFGVRAASTPVRMPVAPKGQDVEFVRAVEHGPLTRPGPLQEDAPDPDTKAGPEASPPVEVPVRSLGFRELKDAREAGSLAVIFADRARSLAEAEGFTDSLPACESLLDRCRIGFAKALSASGDAEKAVVELKNVRAERRGRRNALAYAEGRCPLSVASEPKGAAVKLLDLPDGTHPSSGKAVREGIAPVTWEDVPEGTYVLLFEKKDLAPVRYPLRIARDLPPEAAHELAVLARDRVEFRRALEAEISRLSGTAPALRLVRVELPAAADVPAGFLVIPAGSFLMGEDRTPAFLETYLAAEQELDAGSWRDFVSSAGKRKRRGPGDPAAEEMGDRVLNLLLGAKDAGSLPAASLSWHDGRAYLRWLNSRSGAASHRLFLLPTEAMWEKAARGVDGRTFPWGEKYDPAKVRGADLRPIANGYDDFITNYDPVSLDRGTSVFGLKHAGGNLWEWCFDEDETNPGWRVLKGGCYASGASHLRLGGRSPNRTDGRTTTDGIRVFAWIAPPPR